VDAADVEARLKKECADGKDTEELSEQTREVNFMCFMYVNTKFRLEVLERWLARCEGYSDETYAENAWWLHRFVKDIERGAPVTLYPSVDDSFNRWWTLGHY